MKNTSNRGSVAFAVRTWMLGVTALICIGASGPCWAQTEASCCAKAESPAAGLGEKSLYQTESKWRADTGKEIKLADLKGRPRVVVMFFASCQSACPILVHDLKRIEGALTPEQRARVGFTLITIDPRRDSPPVLANFRATQGLSVETWTLLQGEPDDTRELAALLGVKYKEQASGQFAHSNLITVLDAKGEIVYQLVGLGQDISATVRALDQCMADAIAQTR